LPLERRAAMPSRTSVMPARQKTSAAGRYSR
jgi:hypothetical protein